MSNLTNRLDSIKMAQALLFLNGFIWLAFGIYSLVSLSDKYPEQSIIYWIIPLLMFGNSGAMLLSAFLLGRQQRVFYYFTGAVVLINIILTVTDQFGLFDLITLLIDLLLIGILILKRKWFLPQGNPL